MGIFQRWSAKRQARKAERARRKIAKQQTKLAAATAASQAAASSQTTGRQAVAGTVNRGVATAATTATLLSRIEELERQMAAQVAINEAQQSEIEDLETELSEAIEELGSTMVQADQNWDGLLKVVQPAASVALDVLNNGDGEVYNREGLIAHEAIEAYISLQGENLTGGQEGIARLIALLAKAWAYYDGASLNSVFQKNAPEAAAPEGTP